MPIQNGLRFRSGFPAGKNQRLVLRLNHKDDDLSGRGCARIARNLVFGSRRFEKVIACLEMPQWLSRHLEVESPETTYPVTLPGCR
jgi:hypothetical protein